MTGRQTPLESRPLVQWIDACAIAAPLPATPWVCRDLQIGPGRPAMLAAYGGTGKTLAMQSLALAVAAGFPVWGCPAFMPEGTRTVGHLDYEQGRHATSLRYQRLAAGMGLSLPALGERLRLALFPELSLSMDRPFDALCRAVEGMDLVFFDSLRASTPGVDENDSRIRSHVDLLSRVSQAQGTAFLLIHHGGKPAAESGRRKDQGRDARHNLRGSSAIFDACGSVFAMANVDGGLKLIRHVKSAAEAERGAIESFHLAIEDTEERAENGAPGLRIVYRSPEQSSEQGTRNDASEGIADRVLAAIRAEPGIGIRDVRKKVGGKGEHIDEAIEALIRTRTIREEPGPNRKRALYLVQPAEVTP